MDIVKSIWVGILLSVTSAQAVAMSPDEFVKDAVDELSGKLEGRRDELADDSDTLYALIDELLLARFDRRTAAQQVLARHWRNAEAEQRERFIGAFYTTLLKRYADGVLEFEPDRIQVLPFRGDATKRTATVKTRVALEDGSTVSVNYTLLKGDDGWKMFDVTIEGVSYVRNFRAEFDSEIKATSLEEVIQRLEAEAAGPAGD